MIALLLTTYLRSDELDHANILGHEAFLPHVVSVGVLRRSLRFHVDPELEGQLPVANVSHIVPRRSATIIIRYAYSMTRL